jgi:hypothetical protein
VASRVQLPGDGHAIDEGSRRQILGVLERIADSLTAIPPASAFWDSMQTSPLQIDAGGFRIVYLIEPEHRRIRVIELQRIPR